MTFSEFTFRFFREELLTSKLSKSWKKFLKWFNEAFSNIGKNKLKKIISYWESADNS